MGYYYLAIDIGASSGRHILGHINNGVLEIREIHRFDNSILTKDSSLCWDITHLFNEIIIGMKKCKEQGTPPISVGIDTWAVDFVLLDKNDKLLGDAISYRDSRTRGIDNEVYKVISESSLYDRTGIQKQLFNTIYQLTAVRQKESSSLYNAESLLMLPDYFHFLLTGIKCSEYTNATTTQLVSQSTKDWDYELISYLKLPKKIFMEIKKPGTSLGHLLASVQELVGYNCEVILPATHDTASAVLAVPALDDNFLYISSGTWSLMGIESEKAECSSISRVNNFTNEGGYNYKFCYLKNIMGLWIIQSVKKELGQKYSFSEICSLASKQSIKSIVDCNNSRFLSPVSMTGEIKSYCRETHQQVPETIGELACVIYNSLAKCYNDTLVEIEQITGRTFQSINIIGGGSQADYLNELTYRRTGRKVYAGPTEATALGNILVQMICKKEIENLKKARELIYNSFDIKTYYSS